MPDVHAGIGATVGSVIPTYKAIIPAAVGVDIGCGMVAVKTSISANDLPDNLANMREAIETRVPVGFNGHSNDSFRKSANDTLVSRVKNLEDYFPKKVRGVNPKWMSQMGTLGGGNHFIEICLDENEDVWIMLHSGSRGFGNWIGRYFIVEGKGEKEFFCSCSHGAGRVMSRSKAKKMFSVDDLIEQTSGVECRKDAAVIDEIPGAYKDIDKVMKNQSDLVSIVHTLKQVLCVKG